MHKPRKIALSPMALTLYTKSRPTLAVMGRVLLESWQDRATDPKARLRGSFTFNDLIIIGSDPVLSLVTAYCLPWHNVTICNSDGALISYRRDLLDKIFLDVFNMPQGVFLAREKGRKNIAIAPHPVLYCSAHKHETSLGIISFCLDTSRINPIGELERSHAKISKFRADVNGEIIGREVVFVSPENVIRQKQFAPDIQRAGQSDGQGAGQGAGDAHGQEGDTANERKIYQARKIYQSSKEDLPAESLVYSKCGHTLFGASINTDKMLVFYEKFYHDFMDLRKQYEQNETDLTL